MTSGKENSNDQTYFVEYTPASKVLQVKAPLIDKNLDVVLQEAEKMLSRKQGDYLEWVKEDLKLLEEGFQGLLATPGDEQAKRIVYTISHSMQGQGGTFGYPLVTYVLHNLCKFLDDNKQLNSQSLLVVGIHINAIKRILTHKLSGKGGEMGEGIIHGLAKAVDRKD